MSIMLVMTACAVLDGIVEWIDPEKRIAEMRRKKAWKKKAKRWD